MYPFLTHIRLYYGSGERRILLAQPSSESMVSLYNNGHVGNSFLNRSPSTERFTAAIFNPRRRPREPSSTQARPQTQESEARSLEISQNRIMSIPRVVKKQTSSIWSPHLRSDRRASRYSLWEPPSAVWSAQGGLTSRRNVQIVLFVLGFVFPFGMLTTPGSLDAHGSNLTERHQPGCSRRFYRYPLILSQIWRKDSTAPVI